MCLYYSRDHRLLTIRLKMAVLLLQICVVISTMKTTRFHFLFLVRMSFVAIAAGKQQKDKDIKRKNSTDGAF